MSQDVDVKVQARLYLKFDVDVFKVFCHQCDDLEKTIYDIKVQVHKRSEIIGFVRYFNFSIEIHI